MNETIKKMTALTKETFIPIGVMFATLVFVGSGAFSLSRSISEYKSEVKSGFESAKEDFKSLSAELKIHSSEFKNHKKEDWTLIDMERWAFLFERSNKSTALIVPNPDMVKVKGAVDEDK